MADDDSSTETNEIIPREAIQKLDYSVRQALLRAIDKLEKEAIANEEEANETAETTTLFSAGNNEDDSFLNIKKLIASAIKPTVTTIQSTAAVPLTTTKDEILEESTSKSDVFPSVQFFTATYDENSAHEETLSSFIDKSKKSLTNLGSPVVVSTLVTEEPKVSRQSARSLGHGVHSNEISSYGLDEIKFEIRNSKFSHKTTSTAATPTSSTTTTTTLPTTTKKRTTTTTTTTTTTPRPTHNEDGENIEIVNKDDVRIQPAPLVTAFTVNVDELGGAKHIIPIIDTTPRHSAILPVSTASPGLPLTTTTRVNSVFQPFGPTITKLNVNPAPLPPRSTVLAPLGNGIISTPLPTVPTFSTTSANSIFSNIVPTLGHYITVSRNDCLM